MFLTNALFGITHTCKNEEHEQHFSHTICRSCQKQQKIQSLIQVIRNNIQSDNLDSVKGSIEELKMAMTDMIADKTNAQSNTEPMSNLNDL